MEHDMKISPSTVRRLRTERGWSQDQLAIASGLSLRTIQRVEAEGITSMGSAVSLAATFEIQLIELQGEPGVPGSRKPLFAGRSLFLGIAVITLASLIEGLRPLDFSQAGFFMTIMVLVVLVGMLVALPALVELVRKRQFIGIVLAVMGTPLVTLLAAGVIYAVASGRIPSWYLSAMGLCGVGLVIMAARELQRTGGPGNA